jgi:hypothetical protein
MEAVQPSVRGLTDYQRYNSWSVRLNTNHLVNDFYSAQSLCLILQSRIGPYLFTAQWLGGEVPSTLKRNIKNGGMIVTWHAY